MKYFNIILLLLVASTVNAATLDLHLFSKHTKDSILFEGERTELNETNLGLGLSFTVDEELDNVDMRIGFFDNSFNDTSFYAAVDLHTPTSKTISYGLALGFVTGYGNAPDTDLSTLPLFMPHIDYNTKRYRMQLGYLPAPGLSAITLSVGYKF